MFNVFVPYLKRQMHSFTDKLNTNIVSWCYSGGTAGINCTKLNTRYSYFSRPSAGLRGDNRHVNTHLTTRVCV